MGKIAIKNAAYIATFNQQLDELTGADILISNGEIVAVGVGLDIKSFQPDEILNAENYIILPGLVNTHHHLYQTLTRCIPRVQSSPLFDWLVNLYEIWRELTPEAVYWSSLLGFAELIRTGCTTTTDQHYVFPRQTSTELIDVQIQAAREIGIRFHPCRGSMSRGKSKNGLPPDDLVQSEDEILSDSQRLIEK
ncbi:MAG: amidohydrolase family protein, partial [Candidatus Sumerlaeia bacterium]|nr:amidohydrolase family protein [Candidatus Sumerlaeia bacterium]